MILQASKAQLNDHPIKLLLILLPKLLFVVVSNPDLNMFDPQASPTDVLMGSTHSGLSANSYVVQENVSSVDQDHSCGYR